MSSPRPGKLGSTKSFSRYESTHAHPSKPQSRASTLSGEVLLPGGDVAPSDDPLSSSSTSVFERRPSDDGAKSKSSVQSPEIDSFPDGFDELPIELVSLTDRFIASLTTAKIYQTPLSIDELSELYQEFYQRAESHISTHIQILSSRQYRDSSPAPSIASRASSKLASKTSKDSLKRVDSVDTGQKMLTPNEVSERRRARKLLEHKRVALEEAVERRVCEGIYDKLWRHKSTLDGERDEKLRSKSEALALVGIGLKDLGIELGSSDDSDDTIQSRQNKVEDFIAKARQSLFEMNLSQNPLGKLQGLATTHQAVVDLLTNIHQSSSSADEILPTLIYTLIRSPAENINAISNLNFIQRFRSSGKINGEAAYCLTNLEAAITFLETVDLATLRSEEAVSGSSQTTTPAVEPPNLTNSQTITLTTKTASPVTTPLTARPVVSTPTASASPMAGLKDVRPTPPTSPSHQRRLSSLLQPANAIGSAIGAGSDAVLSTADQGFRNISTTLDNSFKLLFGKLKEQHVNGTGTDARGTVIVPKTLDEARRMVSPKAMVDEDGTISEGSSFTEQEEPAKEDRILDMIAGNRQAKPRDRSVDSDGSTAGGARKVAFNTDSKPSQGLGVSPPVAASAAVESMRNFGNSINPLNRFTSGMNVMRGFGRTNSSTPPVISAASVPEGELPSLGSVEEKVGPPIARFLGMADASEMKVGDIDTLLKDYQRLAQVLKVKGLV